MNRVQSTLTDLKGFTHQVRLTNQWGIQFFMLEEASLWLPVVEDGSWECEQREYFLSKLHAHEAAIGVDIGANNGIYTLLMLREGLRRVISFEPCEPHFSMMREAVNLNGFADRAELHRLACSDRTASRAMYVFPDNRPSLNLLADTRVMELDRINTLGARLEMVDSVPLDDLLDFEGRRLAIKIDTEGHELQVLAGAKRTLSRNDCILQIECFDDALVEPMAELGYTFVKQIKKDHYFIKAKQV